MATAASAQSKLEGKACIGQSIGGKVSNWQVNLSRDCQSMMCLHKGWMDRLLGFTFFSSRSDPKNTKLIKKWPYRWSEPFGTKIFKTFIFFVIFWFLLIRVETTFFSKTFFCTKKRAIFLKKMAL